jgi:hypothetical protein
MRGNVLGKVTTALKLRKNKQELLLRCRLERLPRDLHAARLHRAFLLRGP